jgi:hypothetical protein
VAFAQTVHKLFEPDNVKLEPMTLGVQPGKSITQQDSYDATPERASVEPENVMFILLAFVHRVEGVSVGAVGPVTSF